MNPLTFRFPIDWERGDIQPLLQAAIEMALQKDCQMTVDRGAIIFVPTASPELS